MKTLALTADEIEAWLRLTGTPGLGPVTVYRLLAEFGTPQCVFEQTHMTLTHAVGERVAQAILDMRACERRHAEYARTLAWTEQPDHHFVTLADPAYPRALLEMADPPPVLYVKGHLERLHAPALAMVGSRHASAHGLQNALQFARALADAGVCIVSGLALGIDGAAHRGALEGHAKTIAVIGTGIDLVYPARHHALAHQIAASGAIVSEWPLGAPARAAHFPQRNRLIAGLAQGVLVVEAAAQSGSLITARLAGEMGREVFALPGSIHSPLSRGCHRLIKDGAKLVESVQDVLEELHPARAVHAAAPEHLPGAPQKRAEARVEAVQTEQRVPEKAALQNLEPAAQRVLESLGTEPCRLDALVVRAGLESAALQAVLCHLELEGWIALLPGGYAVRLLNES